MIPQKPKVLLTTLNAKYIHMNLAIRLLYDLNHEHYPNLSFHEFTIKEKPELIAAYCKEFDVVAFSCYIWNITQTMQAAKAIKAANPDVKILLGGPEVSYDYHDVIKHDCIDYIIVGEGEIPFEQFLQHYPTVDLVPNLVHKQHDEVKFNAAQVSFDIQKLAGRNPYQYDEPESLKNRICYVETSRGCPYKCEFCLASLDNKVRYLPLDTIEQNLLYIMQHGRVVKFLDRTFNVKKDFTIHLFDFILKHHQPGQVFQFEITADIVHPDIISYINEHVPPGLFRFEIGIQTVNQKANLEVSRKQNFEKTSKVIKQLDHKIEMHLDLIVGLPLDRFEDIKYSFEEVFHLYPPELQLGFLKFLKGTPVRLKHEQHGYKFDPNPPYQIIESNYLSKDELHQITWLEEALEIYWNKKRTPLSLKYVDKQYSIFDFLLGLGKLFQHKSNFHKHSLDEVFDIIKEFVENHYSNDTYLQQLIIADYYLYAKIKPQVKYIQEPELTYKYALIQTHKLNHHKNRHIIFKCDFSLNHWINEGSLNKENCWWVFEYNGTSSPRFIELQYEEVTA